MNGAGSAKDNPGLNETGAKDFLPRQKRTDSSQGSFKQHKTGGENGYRYKQKVPWQKYQGTFAFSKNTILFSLTITAANVESHIQLQRAVFGVLRQAAGQA